MHIKVNNDRKSAISSLFMLKNFRAYPFLEAHILFYSDDTEIKLWGTQQIS